MDDNEINPWISRYNLELLAYFLDMLLQGCLGSNNLAAQVVLECVKKTKVSFFGGKSPLGGIKFNAFQVSSLLESIKLYRKAWGIQRLRHKHTNETAENFEKHLNSLCYFQGLRKCDVTLPHTLPQRRQRSTIARHICDIHIAIYPMCGSAYLQNWARNIADFGRKCVTSCCD